MAVTVTEVAEFIGAVPSELSGLLTRCLAESKDMVDNWVGQNPVPESIRDRAYVEVAADLWNRRNAPNGISNMQYMTADGSSGAPIRIARDPMAAAYPILRPFVSPW